MAEPARNLPTECPRVVDATDDGKGLVTCGHTIPCPYHGMPLFVIEGTATPDTDGGEGSG